jgi:large subunit ribosomal protein L29
MELAKIRNLSDEELMHQEKTSSEQLFRLRFQVSLGQNDSVKKLRELRREIAQIKTIERERELGLHGETKEAGPAAENKAAKAKEAEPVVEAKAGKADAAAPSTKAKTASPKKAAPAKKTAKAAAGTEKKTGKAKGASK